MPSALVGSLGFLLGRDGRVMSQLGPLAADDDGIARALLARAIAEVPAPLTIDVPDRHSALGSWLTTLGFTAERPYIRMIYGTNLAFDDNARLFAIAGPNSVEPREPAQLVKGIAFILIDLSRKALV